MDGTAASPPLFAPIDLRPHLNASARSVLGRWHPRVDVQQLHVPTGTQRYWGVEFVLPSDGGNATGEVGSWLLLPAGGAASPPVHIALSTSTDHGASSRPSYILFLHSCGVPTSGSESLDADFLEIVKRQGEHVATYVLDYADGSTHRQAIRWRFEINGGLPAEWLQPFTSRAHWWQRPFASRPQVTDAPLDWRGPYAPNSWGKHQLSVGGEGGPSWFYVYALPNPTPEKPLMALRLEGNGTADIAIGAVTLFYGLDHPLRHRQLATFQVSMSLEARGGVADWAALSSAVDLGIIARRYAVPAFDAERWLGGEGITRPLSRGRQRAPAQLFVDLAASADATLAVGPHRVALRPAYERGMAASADGALRVEVVAPRTTWLRVQVLQSDTGQAVPTRLHFHDRHGRYLPPYGHRHEVNDNWFEDYGADLKLHGTSYAYVDGTFQIELPADEVYVEIYKGLEYRPVRQKLTVAPGQRELRLTVERPLDWRKRGWVTADTHVHFISPQTAWLQGEAEGVNVINLLASQWGDLFSNVGDLTGGLAGASRGETLIWVGTENRQHMLGHISLLGTHGEPVFPMATAGPVEGFIGDPAWSTLAEWADEARRKDGVVVLPHFPTPYCEAPADIVLGKIDAVELTMAQWQLQLHEWYRYLNCGYRVAAVGGTDKMSAAMPVGAIRTYALLAVGQPFTYEAWAAAVRAGRTFATTGPLLELRVEGSGPGEEVQVAPGGGTLHVTVLAESVVPFHCIEVVVNGEIVAAREYADGAYRATLEESLRVQANAWIAARCTSQLGAWVGAPRPVAAHTSPVYVVGGDRALFNHGDASYMLTLIDGALTWLDTLAIPASPEHQARHRAVFERARHELRHRLQSTGQ